MATLTSATFSTAPTMMDAGLNIEGIESLEGTIKELKQVIAEDIAERTSESSITDVVDLMRVLIDEIRDMKNEVRDMKNIINVPPPYQTPVYPQVSSGSSTWGTALPQTLAGAAQSLGLANQHSHGGTVV